MTIKYSPELKRDLDGDWVESARRFCWCCASGMQGNWDLFGSETCWVAVSDRPTRGAIELELGVLHHHILRVQTGGWRNIEFELMTMIRSFDTDRVWVWIEIPNE